MKTSSLVRVEGRELELTNLAKVLWPEEQYNKADLINYYAEIYPWLAPHLKDRPLVITRYPDGIEGNSFYQKNVPENLPNWMKTYSWNSKERTIRLLIVTEKADVVWLANLACIEFHPWLSGQQSILNPDYMIFDLDPSPDNTLEQVKQVALTLKKILDSIGLRSYIKTSGAQGMHIYVPLKPEYSYEQVRETAGAIAGIICGTMPDLTTIERSVSKRGAKIYIDYMQNVIGKTVCAPYSVRPRKGAPVSIPLDWGEVPHVNPDDHTIRTVLDRVASNSDLFLAVLEDKQDLVKLD